MSGSPRASDITPHITAHTPYPQMVSIAVSECFHSSLDNLELQFTKLGQVWSGLARLSPVRGDTWIIVNKWTDMRPVY